MITIYSMPTCSHCKELKEYLDGKKIEYEDINLADPLCRGARRYYQSLPSEDLPVIMIGGDVIQGFNRKKIDKILGDKYDK